MAPERSPYRPELLTIPYILFTIKNTVLNVESLVVERGCGRVLCTVQNVEIGGSVSLRRHSKRQSCRGNTGLRPPLIGRPRFTRLRNYRSIMGRAVCSAYAPASDRSRMTVEFN